MKLNVKIDEYISAILELSFEDFQNIAQNNKQKLEEQYLVYDNIENIEYGITGYLFFLLEYYKKYNKPELLNIIEKLSFSLIAYCDRTATVNYSLYTGRGGVAYFLLKLYKVAPQNIYLENCLKILKDSEKEFFHSEYTSDYLLDGRAGVLFILLDLFTKTESKEIEEMINNYLKKIINNSVLTSHGISWISKEEINVENSCDFCRGSLGILFVLRYMYAISKNENIQFYSTQTEKYIKNFIYKKEEEINLEGYPFMSDIEKRYLLKINSEKENYIRVFNILLEINEKEKFEENLDLLMSLSPSHFNHFSEILYHRIDTKEELTGDESILQNLDGNVDLESGIIHGKTGVFYTIMKYSVPAEKNIFENQNYNLHLDILPKEDFIFQKQYPKFYHFTKVNFPLIYNMILNNIEEDRGNLISDIIPVIDQNSSSELLKDLLSFEEIKNQFHNTIAQENNLTRFSKIISHRNSVFDQVESLGSSISEIPIKLSSMGTAVNTKWDWSSNDIYKHTLNIIQPPASFATIFIPVYDSRANYVEEISLQIEELLLQSFSTPKTINMICEEFKYFCLSQPEEVLDTIITYTYSKDREELIRRMDYLMTSTVKNFIYSGCLEFV
ncbi:lanthionine synthetase LanC family protein [uncultured Chryseobacterium sp.]|uniref:lanthionine synthetase LanC family protein n=1 Tax=uncultured Chryseobacterium sp. TaxID=259322 RepID=UPI0027DAD84F|nr:lanthionine synthetase LanC family protein [uncultured Chryseobacterium sp.]